MIKWREQGEDEPLVTELTYEMWVPPEQARRMTGPEMADLMEHAEEQLRKQAWELGLRLEDRLDVDFEEADRLVGGQYMICYAPAYPLPLRRLRVWWRRVHGGRG